MSHVIIDARSLRAMVQCIYFSLSVETKNHSSTKHTRRNTGFDLGKTNRNNITSDARRASLVFFGGLIALELCRARTTYILGLESASGKLLHSQGPS